MIKGKILKIKVSNNPNSSAAIASTITLHLTALLNAILGSLIASILYEKQVKKITPKRKIA
jgi:hypothetical protein